MEVRTASIRQVMALDQGARLGPSNKTINPLRTQRGWDHITPLHLKVIHAK